MMTLLQHIRACNNWDAEAFIPLLFRGRRIGLMRRENAALLREFPTVFVVSKTQVALIALKDAQALTTKVEGVVNELVRDGTLLARHGEYFPVKPRWAEPVLFELDRGALPFFGIRGYGVHLNAFCRIDGELHLWIGKRAADKRVEPNKLDNMVAGGIGAGHGIVETLIKEAGEEAALAPELAAKALPVGALTYRMGFGPGLRDDVLFLFDLELPPDFTPHANDGEIAEFMRLPARAVLDRVRRTTDFKFNVNLVLIDFALRHGLIDPEDSEYLDIAAGLHRPLD